MLSKFESGRGVLPPKALWIAGPTGVGKSEIVFRLARETGGEIISVDSMQVYRGLDIGTAKPSEEQRREIPHHLIDVVDITEPFDAAQFVLLAQRAVNDIHARGRLPILCGGTGLYFKALRSGLGSSPAGNQALRAQLERMSLSELLHELATVDPVTYDRIDQKNRRRVIRAVEVIRLTGTAYSSQRAAWEGHKLPEQGNFLCLTREIDELRHRIDARVDAMFRAGLVAETKTLLLRGLAQNRTAMQAIGYRQAVEFLQGQRSLSETIQLVKIRTRQFAKRQMTWFRKEKNLEWITLEKDIEANLQKVRLYTNDMKKNHLSYGPKDGIVL
jgi:tRNA dimethylallyltransferase